MRPALEVRGKEAIKQVAQAGGPMAPPPELPPASPGAVGPAIAVANRVMYQGFNNGRMEALDADTGKVLWEHTLPTARRGGFAISNGALYCSNGLPGGLRGGGGPGINPPDLAERHRNAGAYSVYCFTVNGR